MKIYICIQEVVTFGLGTFNIYGENLSSYINPYIYMYILYIGLRGWGNLSRILKTVLSWYLVAVVFILTCSRQSIAPYYLHNTVSKWNVGWGLYLKVLPHAV